MHSPFDADYPPPPEPPASLDEETAPYWTIVAEQWHPDDEARDKILLGMLVRADQSTIAPGMRARLAKEAERALGEHCADEQGRCVGMHSGQNSRSAVRFPCWSVTYARLVTADTAAEPDVADG